MSNLPPAGWYEDPEQPGQQRYWDGQQWTDHRAPRAGTGSPAAGAADVTQPLDSRADPHAAGEQPAQDYAAQGWSGHGGAAGHGEPAWGEPSQDEPSRDPSTASQPYASQPYASQPYASQPYGGATQTASPSTNGMAIASLVLSLLWILGIGSLAAVILGLVALSQIKKSAGRQGGRGLAIAGTVVGALGLVGTILMVTFVVWLGNEVGTDFGSFMECIAEAQTPEEQEQCGEIFEQQLNQ